MDDGPDFERETETGIGFPLLGAMRPYACCRLVEDDDPLAKPLTETLVLPNLVIFYHVIRGVRVGESVVTSPQYARDFASKRLPSRAAEVTDCACEHHEGKSMLMIDLASDLAAE